MKYVILVVSFFLTINSYSQTKKPKQKKSQVDWTWNGKKVTLSQLRDSMGVFYLKFCDSVNRKK